MTINADTGLPSLPDKHFWRVTRGVASEYVYLQIRRKRLIGSVKVSDSIMSKAQVSSYEIRQSAVRALRNFDETGSWKKFVGDYPPKRLSEATNG